MKKLWPVLLTFVCLLSSDVAVAQVKLPTNTDRMTIVNLRNYMLGEDGKSVSPFSSVDDTEEVPLNIDPDGKMRGNPFTMGCVKMWETGEGRMFYNLKGGKLQVSDTCENIGETEYEWTTNVTLSPGRLTLNGEARTVASCPENRPNCERTRTVATERATIRIEGSKCFVESYQFRTTETSRNPYLPTATNTTFVTFSTAKSRCSFLLW